MFPRHLGADDREEPLTIGIRGIILGMYVEMCDFLPVIVYSRNKVWCQQGRVVSMTVEGTHGFEQAHADEIWHNGCFLYTRRVIGSAASRS